MTTDLGAGVHWLDLGTVGAYLYESPDGVVLVDAGAPWHVSRLREAVADAGFDLRDVDRVLLTHYDVDHVGGLAGLDALRATPVVAADPDAAFLTGAERPPWGNHKGALQRLVRPLTGTADVRVERVADGETTCGLTAYHTPGHTPGHVAYVNEEVGFLGDLVRSTGGELAPSPWVVSYDAAAARASVADLAARAPEFRRACPGHGPPLLAGGGAALPV